jgi:hypothetical protein
VIQKAVALTFHATSSLTVGLVVPIPTFQVLSTLILLFQEPSAMIILFERVADNPVTFDPSIVLFEPVVIPLPVLYPRAVLLLPEILSFSAL